jgi:hypothetical protein
MKTTLQLEEVGMFLLGILLFNQLNFAWWWFLVLILTPDLSMIGYGFGNKIGAISYNFFHHKGIAILVYILGIYTTNNWIQCAGIILFSHASMDRIMGYGLKYEKGFKFTHLGAIGKNK